MAALKPRSQTLVRWPAKMGLRTQEVRPVGAWVQPETIQPNCVEDAVYNAQLEQERLDQEQRDKIQRLKRFQEDVKKRVQALDRVKKQQALEKSYRAVEVERNVVHQSALAAEKSTPRKNRCSVRHSVDLSIRHSATVNTQGGIINPSHAGNHHFEEQSHKVHKYTRQARRNLVSRKLISEHHHLHDELPGGVWKTGPTLDHPASRDHDGTTVSVEELHLEDEDHSTGDLEQRIVRFDQEPSPENTRQSRITRKSATELSGSQVTRYPTVPNIYPGVQSEEEKTQTQNQRAMYRRLFMDIEREQVKENQRRRAHRKKINDIKRSAELERESIEDVAHQLAEPKDPVTGQTEAESFRQKVDDELRKKLEAEDRLKQIQRNKETERFLDALKRNLREKIEKSNIELPPLCSCGPSVWDTSPDTCANNCTFYKNHKAYAAALQSLLASFDII